MALDKHDWGSPGIVGMRCSRRSVCGPCAVFSQLSPGGCSHRIQHAECSKKINRLMRQAQINAMKTGIRIKFGVRVPRDMQEAMTFDNVNDNMREIPFPTMFPCKAIEHLLYQHADPAGGSRLQRPVMHSFVNV